MKSGNYLIILSLKVEKKTVNFLKIVFVTKSKAFSQKRKEKL